MIDKFLNTFFLKLNSNNVNYCVLRNYEFLPKSTGGSDLDILITKINDFYLILNKVILDNSIQVVSYIHDEHCPKICLLKNNWGIQIDVFNGNVKFGGKEIIPAEFIWDVVEKHNDINKLNDSVASLLAFLKELLNNKKCKQKYITDLKKEYTKNGFERRLLSNFDDKFTEQFLDTLINNKKFNFPLLYSYSKLTFNKTKFTAIKNKIKRIFNQPGYTIAFLGTDGSGKSTIIKNIEKPLNDAFHNAVYYNHMRPNYIPSLVNLFGKDVKKSGPITEPHSSDSSGFIGSLIRWLYYLIDYTLGYLVKIFTKKAIRSCVFIFDRYYYDFIIDPKRARIKLPRWILKLGQFIIPEPDIIICLGTDAEKIDTLISELN